MSEYHTPLVSIIIPCYNAGPWIAEALDSALAQTHRPLEIIVIDDGSADDSLAVIARYAAQYPDLIRYETGPNRGGNAARNRGFALSQGEYVLFLDADDLLSPDTIAALYEAIQDKPQHLAICPWVRFVKHDSTLMITHQGERFPIEHDPIRSRFGDSFILPIHSLLWPRETIEEIGGWDETLNKRQDGDIFLRAILHGRRLSSTDSGMAFYRDTPNSISRHVSPTKVYAELRFTELLEQHLAAHDRLNVYADVVSKQYFSNAIALYQIGDTVLAENYERRARELAGSRAIHGPFLSRLLCRTIGLKRKEQLADFLARFGIGSQSRLAWYRSLRQPAQTKTTPS